MNKECTTTAPDTAGTALATVIRRMFEEHGWTIDGLRDDITEEQAVEVLTDFLRKLEAVTA